MRLIRSGLLLPLVSAAWHSTLNDDALESQGCTGLSEDKVTDGEFDHSNYKVVYEEMEHKIVAHVVPVYCNEKQSHVNEKHAQHIFDREQEKLAAKEAAKAAKLAEKLAQKEAEKAIKIAEKEAAKAEKLAQKAAEKKAKKDEKEIEKAAKEAIKAAKIAEKAKELAAKEALKAAKAKEKAEKLAEKEAKIAAKEAAKAEKLAAKEANKLNSGKTTGRRRRSPRNKEGLIPDTIVGDYVGADNSKTKPVYNGMMIKFICRKGLWKSDRTLPLIKCSKKPVETIDEILSELEAQLETTTVSFTTTAFEENEEVSTPIDWDALEAQIENENQEDGDDYSEEDYNLSSFSTTVRPRTASTNTIAEDLAQELTTEAVSTPDWDADETAEVQDYIEDDYLEGDDYYGDYYSGDDYSGDYYSGDDYSGDDYSGDDYSGDYYSGDDYSGDDYSDEDQYDYDYYIQPTNEPQPTTTEFVSTPDWDNVTEEQYDYSEEDYSGDYYSGEDDYYSGDEDYYSGEDDYEYYSGGESSTEPPPTTTEFVSTPDWDNVTEEQYDYPEDDYSGDYYSGEDDYYSGDDDYYSGEDDEYYYDAETTTELVSTPDWDNKSTDQPITGSSFPQSSSSEGVGNDQPTPSPTVWASENPKTDEVSTPDWDSSSTTGTTMSASTLSQWQETSSISTTMDTSTMSTGFTLTSMTTTTAEALCPDGEYYDSKKEECKKNKCDCNHGYKLQKHEPGYECLEHGGQICKSCYKNYILRSKECVQYTEDMVNDCPAGEYWDSKKGECKPNKCDCDHGKEFKKHDDGYECLEHEGQICESCDANYILTEKACIRYTEDMGEFTCPGGYHVDKGNKCKENKCKCDHGKEDKDAVCAEDGGQLCESCDAKHTLIEGHCIKGNAKWAAIKFNNQQNKGRR